MYFVGFVDAYLDCNKVIFFFLLSDVKCFTNFSFAAWIEFLLL